MRAESGRSLADRARDRALVVLACLAAAGATPVFAQDSAPAPKAGPPAPASAPASPSPAAIPPPKPLDARKLELRGVQDKIERARDKSHKLSADIESMRADRARLAAALIETTTRAQAAEAKIADIQKRLDLAQGSETAIRRSLESRRDMIADVLAALQRMERRPPPAVLVSPEDMLRAVRTSILLGAVVPELRSDAEALASDLSDLVHLRAKITAEKTQLAASVSDLEAERKRLSGLVAARTKAQSEAESALAGAAKREQDLAKQASDLKDLIARMESASGAGSDAAGQDEAAALRQSARLSPAVAFVDARGSLHLPVSGAVLKDWGAPDGYGGTEKGDSIATRPGAIVAAPADSRVVFAGPYRSYGELLILNAGGGYHIVLAGMDRINVSVGQFVLAGEPVGVMGDGSARTAAAIAIGAAQPVLYVEFRKDGAAIDPAPWWAKPEMEKARG